MSARCHVDEGVGLDRQAARIAATNEPTPLAEARSQNPTPLAEE